MLKPTHLPTLGFVAPSGTGKTTLLTHLLPLLKARGLRAGMIKHAHHNFDTDLPGKDSYELRKAGAAQMLIASRTRSALITEYEGGHEPVLDELLQQLARESLDLVLVEGFKHEAYPKIELHRRELAHPLLYPHDSSIVAIATNDMTLMPDNIVRLDINNVQSVLDFTLTYLDIA